jgi:hypothetical protein
MNGFSKALAEAHAAVLHHEAETARGRAAAREAAQPWAAALPHAVTLRLGAPNDASALRRLAELDSSHAPPGPVIVAEVDGAVRAAVSLSDGTVIADPFHATAQLVQLLHKRAEQLLGDRSQRLDRLREAVSAFGPRHRQRRLSVERRG